MKKQKKKNSTEKSINLNEELIIGLTPKKRESVNTTKKSKPKNKTQLKKKSTSLRKKTKKKQNKKNNKIVKWIILIMLIILCIVLFLLSSVFNIKQVVVKNNNKVSDQEIIELSGLKTDENMFKFSNNKIKKGIYINPYIEEIKITKKLNGVVELDVKERVPSYMLQYADTYAYINNQGYILELSTTPLEIPVITGINTLEENIIPGKRLENEDLKKLDDVIKIMSNASSLKIDTLITNIDITDSNSYIITMSSEQKIIHFGDVSNINEKMPWILKIIEEEKGIEGEIFVKNPEKKAYFREKV